jgi:hypothetical protein
MTPDPSRGSDPWDPSSWNKYAYVGGDPVNFNDPSGNRRVCVGPYDDLTCREYPDIGTTTNDPRYAMAYLYMAGSIAEWDDEHPREHRTPQQIVTDAVMRSSDRLFNEDCAGIFLSPEANTFEQRHLLSNVLQGASDAGKFRTISKASLPSGTPDGVAGFTTDTLGLIYFVQGGAFFTGQQDGKPLGGALQGLTLSQTQELMVIHEYLHYWGIGADNANQEYTMANGDKVVGSAGISQEVRNKCFK